VTQRRRVRVLIADDHPVVREGLRMMLADESSACEVVGEATDGAEAVRMAEALRPDVVLMDLVMPGGDGIAAARQLRERGVESAVVVLTSFADDERVGEAVRAGALGFLLKDARKAQLLAAVRAAARGEPTLGAEAQRHLLRRVAAPAAPPSPLDALTPRERDVLRLIAIGESNKRIGAQLNVSLGTVKGYVSAIFEKLGVHDRTRAALLAVEHGMGRASGGGGASSGGAGEARAG
jgi:DNA-binding NarL/FixJ family response regulator